jgi:hypothetical protein
MKAGRFVIYANPALKDRGMPFPGPNAHVAKDNKSPSSRVARFLFQFVLEAPGSIRGDTLSQEAERLLFPLRLITRAQIMLHPFPRLNASGHQLLLPNWLIRRGDHLKSEVSLPFAAPLRLRGLGISILSASDRARVRAFCARLQADDLSAYEVPMGLFASACYRSREVDSGLDLVTALESMLSESSESIRFKVAFRAACLLETDAARRRTIYELVSKAYGHRNALVHGDKKKRPGANEWFAEHLGELETIVRRTLVACVSPSAPTRLIPQTIDEYLFASGLLGAAIGHPLPTIQTLGRDLWVADLL